MNDENNTPPQEHSSNSSLPAMIGASGIPNTIRGKAVTWVLKLVGGTLGARVVQEAQDKLDTISGRSRVNMLLAEEVARQAIADPELMERAKARFLCEEFRKQENLEAVARCALEELSGEPEPVEAAPIAEKRASGDDPNEDWLNIFSRFAEDASSDRMRELWGRVLAGEIRTPGAFSPTTLRVVAELDKPTALDFQIFAADVLGDFVPREDEGWVRGPKFALALRLEEAGLVSGAGGGLHRSFGPNEGVAPIRGIVCASGNLGLVAELPPAHPRIELSAMLLTKVGKEMLQLVDAEDHRVKLLKLADLLKPKGFTRLWLGPLVNLPGVEGPSVMHYELICELPSARSLDGTI